ncbi:PH domain-containing protein [Maledivibacter halophilus]|uniref:PH domain-containing protein n=1 Tax=Maledivibacter halophilus TaxID=36842 RepID=A0A1T5LCN8_9FIRM|nr:PH domain-containing protein [Maledivibacter halophilus]SKC73787.1 PH domain-containing protein [Maledivibacter halophilus]
MGLFNGLIGNASEKSIKDIEREFEDILAKGEEIDRAFVIIRDLIVFTNKRLILVDKQGVTGKKVEYLSVPYSKINRFSVETAGHFDLDSELKIWLSGTEDPIQKQFKKDKSIYEIQKALAEFVL